MGIVVSAVATGLVHSIAGAECRQLPCGDTLGQKVGIYLICHKSGNIFWLSGAMVVMTF